MPSLTESVPAGVSARHDADADVDESISRRAAGGTYLVSDALPLHVHGLMPPPAAIGPHLWQSTPIDVALAAANQTAELLAVPPPPPPPPPEPPAPEDAAATPTLTQAMEPVGGEVGPADAEPGATSTMAAEEGVAPAVLAAAAAASAVAEATSTSDGGAPLATLDLSRRARQGPPADLPSPVAVRSTARVGPGAQAQMRPQLPPVMPAAGSAAEPTAHAVEPLIARRDALARAGVMSADWTDPAATWPGYVTGLVVALAIGAGVYLSLAGF